jgi:diacylglycerol kinase family enzyme
MTRLAVVVNPTKFDDVAVPREVVDRAANEAGWETGWYETTEDDPGRGQTRQAIADGADVVCPLGGDGTVRQVATELVGTQTPIGLLPGGAGNLLARNLGLPIDDLGEAVRAVVTGGTRRVDVGRITFDDDVPEIFLVMAGMGLDADTMADADEALKARMGWPAYVVSGAKSLVKPGFGVALLVPGAWPVIQRAKSIVVGNCGTLTGDIQLMPDAAVDDGILDAVVVSPRGVFGWAAVLASVVSGRRVGHGMLTRRRARRLEAIFSGLVAAQIDGDAIGSRSRLVAEVDPGALTVRMP